MENPQVKVFATRDALGKAAAHDIAERINAVIAQKGEATVVFAAAPSQNEMLAHLCEEDVDWTKVRAMHQDEYIGLPADAAPGFGNFLRRAIFDRKPFKEIFFIQGISDDPKETCRVYTELLEKYPPDLILLGIGENGHLAFNDPSVADFHDPKLVKIVDLDDVCRMQQVNDGCFAAFDDVPKQAITLTMSLILKTPQGIACVPGSLKANAVRAALHDEISEKCPATALRLHKDAVLYLDNDSASKLNH